jgi:Holliday junction DNA helicase RuvA
MLSFLRGEVVAISGTTVALDVSGVGYAVSVSPKTLSQLRLGNSVTLPVTLIVREESMTLYGFLDNDERALFELLMTVSGVGPKLAQTILAAIEPAALSDAIAAGNEAALVRIPGVGKKSAQRLILELGDKLVRLSQPTAALSTWQEDVVSALVSLGWSQKESQAAVDGIDESTIDPRDPGSALRQALTSLNRTGRR